MLLVRNVYSKVNFSEDTWFLDVWHIVTVNIEGVTDPKVSDLLQEIIIYVAWLFAPCTSMYEKKRSHW